MYELRGQSDYGEYGMLLMAEAGMGDYMYN